MTAARLAAVAGLLADRTRAEICVALFDGRSWTLGELARHVGVAPSTASEHVSRLVAGGFLVSEQHGRHRYIRLADPRIAQVVEDLVGAGGLPAAPRERSLRAVTAASAMARARTCYDHLAGQLGVAITDSMIAGGLLDQACGLAVTEAGADWLAKNHDVDVAAMARSRRPLVRSCLDWTQRRPHLGGAVGAALCGRYFDQGWISRIGTGRAVAVTPAGQRALGRLYGIGDDGAEPA
ncbi:MAG TPA: winged helix-turn-helix domain-containing protein [Streptosporangiaceae bacterium]|nr:winged helix-turn-helix domain-containing protein [Streptosporangiaceae bacterium]